MTLLSNLKGINLKVSQELREVIKNLSKRHSQRQISAITGVSKSHVGRILLQDCTKEESSEIKPKILFLDIETAGAISHTFGRYNLNLSQANIISEGGWLISYAYAWNDSQVVGHHSIPELVVAKNDKALVSDLANLINEADIVVGHNIDKFDLAVIKARMIKHRLKPFKTVRTVDTLKIAKQNKFASNKLDDLGEYLGLGRKVKHEGVSLWVKCQQGDPSALTEMLDYNIQDVVLLRNVYNAIKAYDKNPPNLGKILNAKLGESKHRCPVCASDNVFKGNYTVHTPVSEYDEYVCKSCGHRSRSRSVVNTKEQRSKILITPK
jgi:DNA polymerase III epsilon subunit-like protein